MIATTPPTCRRLTPALKSVNSLQTKLERGHKTNICESDRWNICAVQKLQPRLQREIHLRIIMFRILALLLLTTVATADARQPSADARQPNVVLIMADDMGYEALSANGS